ncbi:MAG: hypothetical protein H0X01_04020 [Nitrospira sp.]|nr:hypothetical protein [Nitrospira sp.]
MERQPIEVSSCGSDVYIRIPGLRHPARSQRPAHRASEGKRQGPDAGPEKLKLTITGLMTLGQVEQLADALKRSRLPAATARGLELS